jgi:TrmH family RNA methyltransferase
VVLVSPRNPLNIGAVARAMANFGFRRLTVVAPFEAHWREARSAIGAPDLLQNARETSSLAEAVENCTLVAGTGTLTYRKPEQTVVVLPRLGELVEQELARAGRVALVFGPEKHGLTREELGLCHALVEIPTDERQPSMNLGQAAAVCLYELSVRNGSADKVATETGRRGTTSGDLELLAGVVEEAMTSANYRPGAKQETNRRELRLLLRRLAPTERDTRRILGVFRRIVWRLKRER